MCKKYKNIISKIKIYKFKQRLDKAIVPLIFNYSRSKIKHLIINGKVKVNGKIEKIPSKRVFGGEIIEINILIEKEKKFKAQNISLNIIYEDQDLIVINKPANLVVHPGIGNCDNTILNALLYYYPPIINVPRAGIVHRLDKNTTGLMVIAKNKITQDILIEYMKNKKIMKMYEAIVNGVILNNNTINLPIARHKFKRTIMSVNLNGKIAITHYRVIKNFQYHTQLHINLETGRTHQIRVHMSYIKHALVGDLSYGGYLPKHNKIYNSALYKVLYNFKRPALHASVLSFYHPTTLIKMKWNAPLPEDMSILLKTLEMN